MSDDVNQATVQCERCDGIFGFNVMHDCAPTRKEMQALQDRVEHLERWLAEVVRVLGMSEAERFAYGLGLDDLEEEP